MDEPVYDRITQVISPFTGIEFVPEEILQPAADRGTRVHKHIEGILKGFEAEADEEISPYIKSFNKYWDNFRHIFEDEELILEKRLYCDHLKITGKPDLIIKTKDRTYILDFKTSKTPHPLTWSKQGAAYRYLLEANGFKNVDDVLFIKLSKEGDPASLYKYENYDEDLETFKKCLFLYRHFKMNKTRTKWRSR